MLRFAKLLVLLLMLPCVALAQVASPFKPGTHGPAELKFVDSVPVLTLAGTPEQIGEQMGVLVGKNSPDPTPHLMEFLKEAMARGTFPAYLKGLTPEAVLPPLKLLARDLKPGFPKDHLAEMEAMAKTSGYDLDLFLFVNAVYDLHTGMGCSTFVVEKGRSANGQPLFGRNFDWLASKGLPQQAMVMVVKPVGKRAFATVTIAPITGAISGMNDAGLAVSINAIGLKSVGDKSAFDKKGTPMLLLFRQVLEECATVEDVEKFLKNARRTTSACLTACDVHGGAVFEITPKNVELRNADKDITLCTNHFCTSLKAKDKACWRMDKLVAARDSTGSLSVESVFSTLQSVHQKASTIQTMVFEPAARTLHVKLGDGVKPATDFKAVKLELAPMFSR
jgi:predicted choloylglycine hydrolase